MLHQNENFIWLGLELALTLGIKEGKPKFTREKSVYPEYELNILQNNAGVFSAQMKSEASKTAKKLEPNTFLIYLLPL